MVLSHENRYNLVVAGMLAGRQPKVVSVYQGYCGLSVSQCLITLQKKDYTFLLFITIGFHIIAFSDTQNDKYI